MSGWKQGLRLWWRAPLLIVLAWLISAIAAMPATWLLRTELHDALKKSTAAETMREGFDPVWYEDFSRSADGLAGHFDPTLAGPGGALDNAERWIDGGLMGGLPSAVPLGLLFAVVWCFFLGGVLERYVHPNLHGSFFAAAGRHGGKILCLGLISAIFYYLIYQLHGWRMDRLEERLRDVTEETTAMTATLGIYLVTLILMMIVRTIGDYAKIDVVRHEGRGVIAGWIQGVLTIVRQPFAAFSPVIVFGLLGAGALALYVALRPSIVTPTNASIIWVAAVGQLYLLARFGLRLGMLAVQSAISNRGK